VDAIPANILVIDDEVGMREGCRRALTTQGFRVSTAEHGAEGLRKLREQQFDLVLLDAMMPGMSGLELLEHIREHDPEIICIMITGYATVDLAAQAMKQGAHDFLPKPFTSEELLTTVRRGLEEHQRQLVLREQKEREEEILQLERARQEMAKLDAIESRFMLIIVHELRNPAGVIKNYLQMMRSGYVEEGERDQYLEQLDRRASQLLDMLDDLLELANLKARRSPSRAVPVAVADILEEVIHKLRPVAEKKGLDIEWQIQARPTLMAQPAHLRSLWTHLITNAIRYTPSGEVRVTLNEEDGQIIGTVADTGIGISTEELGRIFQEFYRSEAGKEQAALGTGLGLSIVNQIMKTYQGEIQVDSTPGHGSTFTFRLPKAASDAEA
jgi:two-component system, sensor histidine kinase and response regulator